jgi:DNA primase
VGAVGRALNSMTYPKWHMYGNKDVPFKCGLPEHKEAIIVEDCASACAVSNILTGVAILGTSLKESHKQYLKQYDKIYVGLDRDATKKSYDIANELKSYGLQNVHVKPLSDDLKYFSTEEIKNIFRVGQGGWVS